MYILYIHTHCIPKREAEPVGGGIRRGAVADILVGCNGPDL